MILLNQCDFLTKDNKIARFVPTRDDRRRSL